MGDADGLLVYSAEGAMVTTIGRRDRPSLATDDLTGGYGLTSRLAAASSFIAYSGRYRYDGANVIHSVETSLFPNWVGRSQVRHVTLSSDRQTLTLSSEPMVVAGRLASQRLTWRRITGRGTS